MDANPTQQLQPTGKEGPGRALRAGKWALVGVTVVVLFGACLLHSQWTCAWRVRRALPRNRDSLVFHDDHEGLLRACREVIARRESYSQADARAWSASGTPLPPGTCSPATTDQRLPQVLRDLRVTYYVVAEDRIRAELYPCNCDCAHFGLLAFAPGAAPDGPDDLIDSTRWSFPPHRKLEQVAIELTPGLWYYDTRLDGPAWVRRAVRQYSQAQHRK